MVLALGLRRPPHMAQVIPHQLFGIGDLALLGVPAEFTTMAGRRLRESTLKKLTGLGVSVPILAGYANAYTTGASTSAVRFDGSVASSGAQFNMSNTTVTEGGTSTVDSVVITLPAA